MINDEILIGDIIRTVRKEKKLTMKELGDKVGLTEQAISQYERCIREPNDNVLNKIFEALEFDIAPYIRDNMESDSVWNSSCVYITDLINYCSKKGKINLNELSYMTSNEMTTFINKNISYMKKLTNDHLNTKKPNEKDVIMNICKDNEEEISNKEYNEKLKNNFKLSGPLYDEMVSSLIKIAYFLGFSDEIKDFSSDDIYNLITQEEFGVTLSYLLREITQKKLENKINKKLNKEK